jgi:hypothetical protein
MHPPFPLAAQRRSQQLGSLHGYDSRDVAPRPNHSITRDQSCMSAVTLAPVRHILHAIATTVIPETASLGERAWNELDDVIERAVAQRGERVRRQIITFLRLVQSLPVVRFGKPFTSLGSARRTAFLESLERSRLLLVRRGVWGVRTLVFMAYYTRDDVCESIGYTSSASGWAARGGTVAAVPLSPQLWIEP